jgi:RNA polymerase sigma-70 factor (ECF subfamily)
VEIRIESANTSWAGASFFPMIATTTTPGLDSHPGQRAKQPLSPEDLALIEAARDGDPAAFQALYRKYHNFVHGLAVARIPYQVGEDVVQDVFSRVYEKLPGLRDARAFPAWLKKVTRTCTNEHLRKRSNTLWDGLPEQMSKEASEVADAHGVLAVMRELPYDYHLILVLRYLEDLSCIEIAQRLEMTHGSVRVKLYRGLKLLRAKLAKRGEE